LKLRSNSVLENKKNRYPEQSICAFVLLRLAQ
jgi:hypothetical protein